MAVSILVVDDNEITLKIVTATLKVDGYEIHSAGSAAEAIEKAGRIRPNLAILDVMMPDMDGYELCKRLRQMPATANIPILILTAFSEINEKLKAFEAGADDFMPKPFQPQELQARVKVHLRRAISQATEAETDLNARKIAIFSLRGGAGVSSLACNLAVGLTQVWNLPVLLLDLAFLNGQSALMLDLPLRNTWADLANNTPAYIDDEVLQKVLLRHECGVEVISAPKQVHEAERITPAHVTKVIELARSQYHYIIMDLPHDFNSSTLAALDCADVILLLLSPDLASVRCASSALAVFDKLGYGSEKVHLVLNWTFQNNGLPRKEIETALKKTLKVVFPYLSDVLLLALMTGKPVGLNQETGLASNLFEDLAFFWSKDEHKQSPPGNPTPAYAGVQERIRARSQKQKK